MRKSFGFLFRSVLQRLLPPVHPNPEAVAAIRRAAGQHSIIYVMPSASSLDYLLMNVVALQQDLPLAEFTTNLPKLWTGRSQGNLVDTLRRKQPAFIFLNKPSFGSQPIRWNIHIWEEILRLQKSGEANVACVPVLVQWGRRPDQLKRSVVDVLFGETSSPGYLRKLYLFFRYRYEVVLSIGKPLPLEDFLEEASEAKVEVQAKKLRRLLSSYLFRERKLLVGPPVRSRERVIRVIMKDTELVELVKSVARKEKKSEAETWKRAEKILREMVSDYRPLYIDVAYRIVKWLWRHLFTKVEVDQPSMDRVKEVARDHPVILLPCHKSHVDYMLLAAIFYENGLMPPHVAAGINLSFFPMGKFFRSTGAYFIRRKVGGDLLYARLLALYVRWLIRTGYSQEFFVEGGRSRNGKLGSPKHGLLSIQVDAFLEGNSPDLYVIPTAITYERVPEEKSYRSELSGEEKEKESFWALLSARKLLGRSHGGTYIRFAPPISLNTYFAEEETREETKARKGRTQELVEDVIRAIGDEVVVTPSSLLACALLATTKAEISENVLSQRVRWMLAWLKQTPFAVAAEAKEMEKTLSPVIEFFKKNGWVVLASEAQNVFRIPEDQRLILDYYKNSILHTFLPAALESSLATASDLKEIFAHEFPYAHPVDAGRFVSTLDAEAKAFFASLIDNYLESYFVAARMAHESDLTYPVAKERLQATLLLAQKLLRDKEIKHSEAISIANFQSAFAYLHAHDLMKKKTELVGFIEMLEKKLKK